MEHERNREAIWNNPEETVAELREEFRRADPFFKQLLQELKPDIENEWRDSILGDDTSGRIPTLVIGQTPRR